MSIAVAWKHWKTTRQTNRVAESPSPRESAHRAFSSFSLSIPKIKKERCSFPYWDKTPLFRAHFSSRTVRLCITFATDSWGIRRLEKIERRLSVLAVCLAEGGLARGRTSPLGIFQWSRATGKQCGCATHHFLSALMDFLSGGFSTDFPQGRWETSVSIHPFSGDFQMDKCGKDRLLVVLARRVFRLKLQIIGLFRIDAQFGKTKGEEPSIHSDDP